MADPLLDDLLKSTRYAEAIDASTWRELSMAFPDRAFDRWLDVLQSAAGAAGVNGSHLRVLARAGIALSRAFGPDVATAALSIGAALGRRAGAEASRAFCTCIPGVIAATGGRSGFQVWLRSIEELSGLAPESVAPVLRQSAAILSRLSAPGFRSWVLNGVQQGQGSEARRLAYFLQADVAALAPFERNIGDVTLTDVERPGRAVLQALWRLRPAVRSATIRPGAKAPRRSSFDSLFFRIPEVYAGYRGPEASAHYQAVLTHLGAHAVHSRERFPKGSLRPLQVALVGLIEDARVEALAIEDYPGLRRLWLRFHTAQPGSALAAELLMARLSRTLIDPDYEDDEPWVAKGRRMFLDSRPQWHDPAISRQIGNLLGNDMGQMRIQFNFKSYVVEPSYRDDNSGLWQHDDPPPEESESAETVLEAVRITEEQEENRPEKRDRDPESSTQSSMAARMNAVDEDAGIPIARRPEWDCVSASIRNEWTTIVEFKARPASAEDLDRVLEEHADVERRIARLVQSAKVSRPQRMRRKPQGDRIDLDACIRASIDMRAGLAPDTRLYESSEMRARDLSVLVLLDVSESTRDRVKDTTTTVIAMERAAAALLAEAMSGLGDPFAIHAFCSNGRSEVRYYRVKDFSESYTPVTRARLAGLRGMMSTRLGAALRQAGAEISGQGTHRRLILVITDGEPADIDVSDRSYLVEDARKAVHGLSHDGVDVFCVGLDSGADSHLPRIFGRRSYLNISSIEALPEKLPMLYFRLTV